MEGPDRRLHGEGGREAEEDPRARALPDLRHVEGPGLQPERDDGDEHEERPREGVDDELDRRAEAARPAPHADEDVERDHHRFPEDVEEQQVLGAEHPDRRAFEEEQEREIGTDALASGPEAVGDRRGRDDDGQADEPEREVEEPDGVGDAELGEPRLVRVELEARVAEVEVERRPHEDGELREGDEECRASRRALRRPRRDPHPQGACDRKEDEDGGEHQVTRMKTMARTASPAASAKAYSRTKPVWTEESRRAAKRTPMASSPREARKTGSST